jgi:hypothetical protein
MIRDLDRSEWREYICDELWPLLEWLDSEHGILISRVKLDIKGVYIDIYLDSLLTADILEAASLRSVPSGVRIGEDWIGCPQHFSSIHGLNGDRASAKQTTLIGRLKTIFR